MYDDTRPSFFVLSTIVWGGKRKKSDNDSHTAVLNVIRTDILLIDRRIHSSSYFFAARAATVLL